MAQVVNTHTRLGRRAARHRVWLAFLAVVGVLVAVSLLRGVMNELGGLPHIRDAGLARATSTAAGRVFNFPGGHLPPPYAVRQLGLLALHLVGLGAVGQLIWLPLIVMRSHAAQQRVLEELRLLPDHYWVLNDLSVPGLNRPSEVDHVVVSPYGLWCLETRPHAGHIVGGEHDYEWLQYKRPQPAGRRGQKFYNPVLQNVTHCAHLTDHLTRHQLEAPVRSMIVFTAAEIATMTMTPVENVRNVVQAMLRADMEKVLDQHTVERIVGSLSDLIALGHPRNTAPPVAALGTPEPHRG